MPIHDWAKVDAPVFHDFHHSWIVEMSRALNGGLLPSDYYCLIERRSGGRAQAAGRPSPLPLAKPPTTRLVAVAPSQRVELDESRLAIRSPDDETIAIVEIVSRGNKRSLAAIARFSARICDHLAAGIHLLVADLHLPGRLDPGGMHGAIWDEWAGETYEAPPGEPLTVVSYEADIPIRAYIEPVAVGAELTDAPLFLEPHGCVMVPMEATYRSAFDVMPRRWRGVLQPTD